MPAVVSSPVLRLGERRGHDADVTAARYPGLLAHLAGLPDPRDRRGRWHPLVAVLAVAVCAVLAGARSLAAIGEWAADAPAEVLTVLGVRQDPLTGVPRPPDEATVRRVLADVDADALDTAVGAWLLDLRPPPAPPLVEPPTPRGLWRAIAVDGKTLRGSGPAGSQVHLLAARDASEVSADTAAVRASSKTAPSRASSETAASRASSETAATPAVSEAPPARALTDAAPSRAPTETAPPRASSEAAPSRAPASERPGSATGAARLGDTVAPLGRTWENYGTYLTDVADHYGINLRGVRPIWDDGLSAGTKGLTKQSERGWVIRINPGFRDEMDLANTLAHELRHARDYQKGLPSPEGPAYRSGNALEKWINGRR